MKKRICKWFGCNAAVVRWVSSNAVTVACGRCGHETSHRRH